MAQQITRIKGDGRPTLLCGSCKKYAGDNAHCPNSSNHCSWMSCPGCSWLTDTRNGNAIIPSTMIKGL